jgi:hypothetical protein
MSLHKNIDLQQEHGVDGTHYYNYKRRLNTGGTANHHFGGVTLKTCRIHVKQEYAAPWKLCPIPVGRVYSYMFNVICYTCFYVR